MDGPGRTARAAAILANILAGLVITACDGQPQRQGEAGDRRSRQAAATGPAAARGAAAAIVGTWRVRLEDARERSKGRVYTFTPDGRVTAAPGQFCRYHVEAEALAVDCTGAARDSAHGRLERRDADTPVWTVDDKAVRPERDAGVKGQQ